jgi:eukaryotic-like serine/threonine-protein kinase
LLFDARRPGDIWALPLSGGQPFRVTQTDFDERQGSFSPDSKWIAYQSDESGRDEIYVRAFAPPENGAAPSGEKTLVSRGGGTSPRWSTDGKEIFYQSADNKIMSAPVTSGTRFQAGEPTALFVLPKTIAGWSPAPDGKRFLVLVGQGEAAQSPFTVVLNWQAGLKK